MSNYFNTLPLREQLEQLGKCRFMDASEFEDGVNALKGKKIVIVGCGAQGLNQGLNMRDSGLDISYSLRQAAIDEQRDSYKNATSNGFTVGTYDELIPTADLVLNLTPDKQHTNAVKAVMPLMKKGATLSYSHGFNIVEEGMKIREDLTVIMVAPKSPGSEVREEYKRGFGVPTLIAVHPENDPENVTTMPPSIANGAINQQMYVAGIAPRSKMNAVRIVGITAPRFENHRRKLTRATPSVTSVCFGLRSQSVDATPTL